MKNHLDAIVIIADDDIDYSNDVIERFVQLYGQHQRRCSTFARHNQVMLSFQPMNDLLIDNAININNAVQR